MLQLPVFGLIELHPSWKPISANSQSRVSVIAVLLETYLSLTRASFPPWRTACKVTMATSALGVVGDIFCVFLITVERFVCINFPLKHGVWVTEPRDVCWRPVSFSSPQPSAPS